jgi:RHS repeat-associated protein
VRETVSTGKSTATVVNHYDGAGQEPTWTSEPSGNTTRDITGIDGALVATQNNTESPVLQIANLHGDIVARASMSETATGFESTVAEANEYGVPATEAPPKYSWLGAHELPTQLPSGVVTMGARSYVPQLGRFLQKDPLPGGSTNPYAYTNGDPVNQTDLSGEYVENNYVLSEGLEQTQLGEEREAAREAAAREEAERLAAEAAAAEEYGGFGEEWEEWEEEEWEYASWHPGKEEGESGVEEGTLYQRLPDETASGEQSEGGYVGSHRPSRKNVFVYGGPSGKSVKKHVVHREYPKADSCSRLHPCGRYERHIFEGNTPEEKFARNLEGFVGRVIKDQVEDAPKKLYEYLKTGGAPAG